MAIKRVLGEINWDTPIRTETQPNVVEKLNSIYIGNAFWWNLIFLVHATLSRISPHFSKNQKALIFQRVGVITPSLCETPQSKEIVQGTNDKHA